MSERYGKTRRRLNANVIPIAENPQGARIGKAFLIGNWESPRQFVSAWEYTIRTDPSPRPLSNAGRASFRTSHFKFCDLPRKGPGLPRPLGQNPENGGLSGATRSVVSWSGPPARPRGGHGTKKKHNPPLEDWRNGHRKVAFSGRMMAVT